MSNWKDYDGKMVALLGRYSFREAGPKKGHWLDQEGCNGKSVHLILSDDKAPKPPERLTIDEPVLDRKLAEIQRQTKLSKFRFGSPDYDRWAVVIGRMVRLDNEEFQLTYRGDGAVFFLASN